MIKHDNYLHFTILQNENDCIFLCLSQCLILYTIFYGLQRTLFYIENDAEILPAHYTWKVAEKGLKMAFMMNRLAMINSCKIILEK